MRRWSLLLVVALAGCAGLVGGPDAGGTTTGSGGGTSGAATTAACGDGWTVLLDGSARSLAAWRHAGPGSFERQDDGTVVTRGGLGLLWHPLELHAYQLQVRWQVAGDDNSGVFVGFPAPGDDPSVAVEQGYEVQIDATDVAERTTGSLHAVAAADVAARDAALRPPGSWNTFVVVVRPERVTVQLNGTTVTDHRVAGEPVPAAPGHVGLQNHGDGDDVRFAEVRVRPLADEPDACAAPVP